MTCLWWHGVMTMAKMASSGRSETSFVSRIFVQKSIRLAGRVVAALGIVAALTFLSFRLAPVNEITAGFLYLVAILLIATAGGPGWVPHASGPAPLCFNYFFPSPDSSPPIS